MNPFFRRAGRSSGLNREIARDNPMRTAPACPPTPPPCAVTTTSTWSAMFVNFSGSTASCFHAWFGKYCSTVRRLIVNFPVPARRKTRATDSLRRPVPRNHACDPARGVPVEPNVPPQTQRHQHTSSVDSSPQLHNAWLPAKAPLRKEQLRAEKIQSSLQRHRLRLLSRVPRQTCRIPVDAQFLRTPRAQLVLRQHPENRLANDPLRLRFSNALRGHFLQSAGVSAVRVIDFLLDLVPGHANPVRVDHHHVISRIQVRSKTRFVFADQHPCDLGCQASQHLIRRVHHKPVGAHLQRLGFFTLGYIRPHNPWSHLSL